MTDASPFKLKFRVGQHGYEDDAHYVEDASGERIVEDVTREKAKWIAERLNDLSHKYCPSCGHPIDADGKCPSAMHQYYAFPQSQGAGDRVLVPREPTEAMLAAARVPQIGLFRPGSTADESEQQNIKYYEADRIKATWAKMLAAAPSAPQPNCEEIPGDVGRERLDARNWLEDASHENGNYECICRRCGNHFVGHKRRVVCKLCAPQPGRKTSRKDDIKACIAARPDCGGYKFDDREEYACRVTEPGACAAYEGALIQPEASGTVEDAAEKPNEARRGPKGKTMNPQSPLSKDDPILIAWKAYKATPEYDNSFEWGRSDEHRDGSMWAAFLAGCQSIRASARPGRPVSVTPAERKVLELVCDHLDGCWNPSAAKSTRTLLLDRLTQPQELTDRNKSDAVHWLREMLGACAEAGMPKQDQDEVAALLRRLQSQEPKA